MHQPLLYISEPSICTLIGVCVCVNADQETKLNRSMVLKYLKGCRCLSLCTIYTDIVTCDSTRFYYYFFFGTGKMNLPKILIESIIGTFFTAHIIRLEDQKLLLLFFFYNFFEHERNLFVVVLKHEESFQNKDLFVGL